MKKLLVPSLLLLALTSTPAHAGWFSNFINSVTPGGWVEQEWDKAFKNGDSDKSGGYASVAGSSIVSPVPEIDPLWMLSIGAGLIAIRKRRRR